jgi:type II secretory pathway component GspD/PulD (secretin)
MKKIILSLIVAGMAGLLVSARGAQPVPGDDNTNMPPATDQSGQPGQPVPPPDQGNGPDTGAPPAMPPPDAAQGADNAAPDQNQVQSPLVITPSRNPAQAPVQVQSRFTPPTQPGTNASDLNLDFNHAPIEMVLNYLADAAGFIVVQQTRINSSLTMTVNGKHLTQTEAVDLLNSVLNQNGYAAIRQGRTLTIMDKNDAKTSQIPVRSGNNPDDIPDNAEMVTQIIPIRFVEARQLVSDLSSFVSPQATVVANEAGNSIVITDTQANIHHLAEIIRAVDDSAEAETEIRVFPLAHANPTDVATELGNIFPSSSSGNTSQSPIRFGGGGPGGPGGFFARMMAANAGAGAGGSSSDRIKKATQVTAVADLRTSSVIVTAPKDLMDQIAEMMRQLDVASDRDQNVYVYKLNNADPQQAAQVLQNVFGSTRGSSTTSGTQNSALQQRTQNNNTTTGSQSSSSGFGTGGGGAGGARGGGGLP